MIVTSRELRWASAALCPEYALIFFLNAVLNTEIMRCYSINYAVIFFEGEGFNLGDKWKQKKKTKGPYIN